MPPGDVKLCCRGGQKSPNRASVAKKGSWGSQQEWDIKKEKFPEPPKRRDEGSQASKRSPCSKKTEPVEAWNNRVKGKEFLNI